MLSYKPLELEDAEYYSKLTRYFTGHTSRRRGRNGQAPGDDEAFHDAEKDESLHPDALTMPGEPSGIWMGPGAEYLGLYGEITEEDLERIFRGEHPKTGIPLVQNAGAANRVPAQDFTFSVPKSVSTIWSQAEPELRQQIEQAVERAVRETIDTFVQKLVFSRVGKAGKDLKWVSAKPVVAAYEHGSSRAGDPNLHWHALLINVGVRPDGSTGSIDFRPFFKPWVKLILGAIFRAILAFFLREIGFRTKRKGTSFEIVDAHGNPAVPQQLLDAHSTRRREIVEFMEKSRLGRRKGRRTGKSCHQKNQRTRPPKSGAICCVAKSKP